jgi:hypothetical protein
MERTRQPVPVEAIREQIIVRADPDDLTRELVTLVRADDQDRYGRGSTEQFLQRGDAGAIGQPQIE